MNPAKKIFSLLGGKIKFESKANLHLSRTSALKTRVSKAGRSKSSNFQCGQTTKIKLRFFPNQKCPQNKTFLIRYNVQKY